MTVKIKDWYGLLELYIIVERWRPWFKRFNEFSWGVFIVDRAFWETIDHD